MFERKSFLTGVTVDAFLKPERAVSPLLEGFSRYHAGSALQTDSTTRSYRLATVASRPGGDTVGSEPYV
jgi:hypothetical protein